MRKIFFALLCILLSNFCSAQFYKAVLPSPDFSNALEKIVLDFRINFSSIQGNNISNQNETDTYESTIKLPGAVECFIYRYHSKADTSASWQGIMYRGDNNNEATRIYENVFRLVKKTQIRWIDKTVAGFSGEMEKPKDNVRFAESILHFELDDERYKNFEANVEKVYTYDGWEVRLNLQRKKPDTE